MSALPPPLSFTDEREDDDAAPAIGMAPLVDIVLLLICFYLLVMQSLQSFADATLDLPVVSPAAVQSMAPASLTINIGGARPLTLNGEAVTLDQLAARVRTERQRATDTDQNLRVVVRAGGEQPFAALDDVTSILRDAGVAQVTLRAREQR